MTELRKQSGYVRSGWRHFRCGTCGIGRRKGLRERLPKRGEGGGSALDKIVREKSWCVREKLPEQKGRMHCYVTGFREWIEHPGTWLAISMDSRGHRCIPLCFFARVPLPDIYCMSDGSRRSITNYSAYRKIPRGLLSNFYQIFKRLRALDSRFFVQLISRAD